MVTYLITGATGMVGGLVINTLIDSEEYINGNIRIIAIVRNISKFQSIFKGRDCRNVKLIEQDIEKELNISDEIDYIIHCAAITRSSLMISNPVEVANGIVLGTHNMLQLAKEKSIQSMVYISSMEVYGVVEDDGKRRSEDELGRIEINNSRSCYPLAKRMAEHYCHIYNKEYGVPVKIVRLAQTFGKGVDVNDSRVYMQFAKAVCDNTDIILRTDGKSMGNYCDSEDAINAIFTILIRGIDGEAYNVVNEENTMSIYEMAKMVAKDIANNKINVYVKPEDAVTTGYAPNTGLRLSSAKLNALGWYAQKNLKQMYETIIEIILKNG